MTYMIHQDVILETVPSLLLRVEGGTIKGQAIEEGEAVPADADTFHVSRVTTHWPAIVKSNQGVLEVGFKADAISQKQTEHRQQGNVEVAFPPSTDQLLVKRFCLGSFAQ